MIDLNAAPDQRNLSLAEKELCFRLEQEFDERTEPRPRGGIDFNGARPQNEPRRNRINVDDIRDRLNPIAEDFVRWFFADVVVKNGNARIGNMLGEPGTSLSIELSGPRVGKWRDHATGVGGNDLIGLYCAYRGFTSNEFPQALVEIAHDFLGDPITIVRPALRPTPQQQIEDTRKTFADQRQHATELGAPVRSFKYYSASRLIIAQVCRYEPDGTRESKTFRTYSFEMIDGIPRWKGKMPDPRPLYRLPEIAQANTIILTEGEAKADALAVLGFAATSIMGGANAVAKTDWTPLKGKPVVIWPDNDQPGQDFARDVTAMLMSLGCKVSIVQIPAGKVVSWDVVDCIAEGGDPAALIAGAMDVNNGSTNASGSSAGTGTGNGSTGNTTGNANSPPPLIKAKPFVLRDPKSLPKRQWIYGSHLIRKFGSATFAPSGSGKTNLFIVEALAIATGRALLGVQPRQRARVWLWNGEDPYDELERRVGAACLHYGIMPEEIDGWLFINSGRDAGSKIVIATQSYTGVMIAVPMVEAIIQTVRDYRIDVVFIDPFISSHNVTENDNNAVDAVAKTWTMIADVTDIAIDLGHHTRKTGGGEVTVEDGRGAVALLNAVRPARVLNVMTEEEAIKAGITDGRKRYFKVTDGKNNLSLPLDKLNWFRSASVNLGNRDPRDLLDEGDDMGVVTAWKWPDPLAGMTGADFDKVAAVIRRGKWRENSQAKAWVGYAVAKALGLNAGQDEPDRPRVVQMLKAWIKAGSLIVVDGEDENRDKRKFVEVKDENA